MNELEKALELLGRDNLPDDIEDTIAELERMAGIEYERQFASVYEILELQLNETTQ